MINRLSILSPPWLKLKFDIFEQGFLYKCIGVVLRKTNTTDFVREHLNLLFTTVDHTNEIEREGCAMALGFCAASHLDQCLVKLEEVTKNDMVRKSTGFMGFMKVCLFMLVVSFRMLSSIFRLYLKGNPMVNHT